jgi:magnesium-protoporphyrin IX monomethyl ester (oxidative) cyclase
MRANPTLLTGFNKLYIRMFLVLVYSTMYVRDHSRPKLYEAFGMDVTEFDHTVFDITTEISKQVFPMTLNTRDPKFQRGLERLLDLNVRADALENAPGLGAKVRRMSLQVGIGATILRLFLLPTIPNEIPKQVSMRPAW